MFGLDINEYCPYFCEECFDVGCSRCNVPEQMESELEDDDI